MSTSVLDGILVTILEKLQLLLHAHTQTDKQAHMYARTRVHTHTHTHTHNTNQGFDPLRSNKQPGYATCLPNNAPSVWPSTES